MDSAAPPPLDQLVVEPLDGVRTLATDLGRTDLRELGLPDAAIRSVARRKAHLVAIGHGMLEPT